MTVNKKRVRLLIDALRSGEFQQGKGNLRDTSAEGAPYHHCCLGVATEVALRNGCKVGDEGPWVHFQQDMHPLIAAWYGLERNPKLTLLSVRDTRPATVWNDDLEASFHTIADAFEATYIDETPAA